MEEEVVYRGASKRACRDFALVLQSRGIPFRQVRELSEFVLLVPTQFGAAALNELASYRDENSRASGPMAIEWSPKAGRLEALAAAVVLAAFYSAQKVGYFGLNWVGEGRVDAGLGVAGNLDRSITALTLHADLRHLLSNVLYGCLFSLLLSQAVGAGIAWVAIILSGFIGNLLSVWVSGPHSSIGASTMVFGTLGILAAYQWRVRKRARMGIKQWAPLVAGSVLLGFFGFGEGARTNYMAHLTGFVAGVALGASLGSFRPLSWSARWQRILLSSALGMVILAWIVAFVW